MFSKPMSRFIILGLSTPVTAERFVIGTVHNLEIPYVGHKSFFSRAAQFAIQASFLLPTRKAAGSSLPSTAPH